MDTSAIDQLAQDLKTFVLQQFQAPPGTSHSLAFLGTGVAVQPESFLSDGQFNPARVDRWLGVVADPLGLVDKTTNMAQAVPWTATTLMEALAGQAQSLAEPGSDEQQAFLRARSQAAQNLGGDTRTATAPLDWYDPAQVSKWPSCSLKSGQAQAGGNQAGTPGLRIPLEPPPMRPGNSPPLWSWRSMAAVHVEDADQFAVRLASAQAAAVQPASPAAAPTPAARPWQAAAAMLLAPVASNALQRSPMGRVFAAGLQLSSTAAVAAPAAHGFVAQPAVAAARPVSAFSQALDNAPAVSAHAMPAARLQALQAVMVSQEMDDASAAATSRSVAAASFSLDMRLCVVELSRTPWWSELMLTLGNWCVPGLARGALVAEASDDRATGVPVALVLTSDVRLQSDWCDSDRAAATGSTHLGPWMLSGASFSASSDSGQAVLAIPGTQVIACIYRELPALPPASAPVAAAPAP